MGCIYLETVLIDFVSEKEVTKNIFLLLSKVLWSRIYSCYSLVVSNLKQKGTRY